jgi:hypothetical protein
MHPRPIGWVSDAARLRMARRHLVNGPTLLQAPENARSGGGACYVLAVMMPSGMMNGEGL